MVKRTLDSFFSPPSKKSKTDPAVLATISKPLTSLKPNTINNSSPRSEPIDSHTAPDCTQLTYNLHTTYPFPIADLPTSLTTAVEDLLLSPGGKPMTNQPHLDLLYFQPLIPQPSADELFRHLRSTLPFYRVKYSITRFGKTVDINTPRFTTVFGVDETSRFVTADSCTPTANTKHLTTKLVETLNPAQPVSPRKYSGCTPRPIPPSLSLLLAATTALTGHEFNFCLVNYYATGADSITYHSDDERFLGPEPAIASFTLGARRDFLMKHKPAVPAAKGKPAEEVEGTEPIKLALGSGDMVVMRGETQSHWLHSIPKRKGGDADKGRINITLRRAMVPAGTENYYRYNVGEGEVYRWDEKRKEMVVVQGGTGGQQNGRG